MVLLSTASYFIKRVILIMLFYFLNHIEHFACVPEIVHLIIMGSLPL